MRTTTAVCLIAATLISAACHTLRPVTLEEVNALKPSKVHVTRADQSVAIVEGPQVLGDTLVGYVQGVFEEMPASGLTKFVMKRPDKVKTAALIIGTTVGISTFAMLATGTGLFNNPIDNLDCEDDPDQPGCMGM